MEAITETTILFTIGLTLSLVIERLLEIINAVIGLLDSRYNWHRFWTYRAEKLRDKLQHRLRIFEYADPKFVDTVMKAGHSILLGPDSGYQGTVPTVSGDLVRALWVKIILKILGSVIGVFLAYKFHIDFIALWQNTNARLALPEGQTLQVVTKPSEWGIVLTGVVIGLGSGPVHKLITAMEHGWEEKKKYERMKKL